MAADGLYGYAQSEPPLYGTAKKKVPPQIPPKPSLSALLGLGADNNNGSEVEDVFLTTPHQRGRRKSLTHMGAANLANGGTAVRNITHV